MDDDRCVSVTIDHDLMLRLMMGRIRLVDADLPSDVRIVRVYHDWRQRASFGLILHSASFDAVEPGSMYPSIDWKLRLQTVEPSTTCTAMNYDSGMEAQWQAAQGG